MPENKKAIIPSVSLPPAKFPENGHFVRYRIISEDKNRTSHWSPKYFVPLAVKPPIVASLNLDQTSSDPSDWTFSSIWTPNTQVYEPGIVRATIPEIFDIYINWDEEGWQYVGSSNSGFFISNVRLGASTLSFALQTPTFPQEKFESATVFSKTVTL